MKRPLLFVIMVALASALGGCGSKASTPRPTYEISLGGVDGASAASHGDVFLNPDETGNTLFFEVQLYGVSDVTAVNLLHGSSPESGEVVARLLGAKVSGEAEGTVANGQLSASDLQGPLAGGSIAALMDKLKASQIHAVVETQASPKGGLRGTAKEAKVQSRPKG